MNCFGPQCSEVWVRKQRQTSLRLMRGDKGKHHAQEKVYKVTHQNTNCGYFQLLGLWLCFRFPSLTSLVFLSLSLQSLNCVLLLRPHGLQPTRLLCPQHSPGKNTGVGCHFLLHRIFLTQGSNPGLLHFKQILYPLSV